MNFSCAKPEGKRKLQPHDSSHESGQEEPPRQRSRR